MSGEETVIGVKGTDCQKITEELNNAIGKVTDSKPTAEMFEEKITISETVSVKNSDSTSSDWNGASSW